jgi:hypothetical protein
MIRHGAGVSSRCAEGHRRLQGQECQNRPQDSNLPPVLDAAGQERRALLKTKEGEVIRAVVSVQCFELRQLHVWHRLASSAAYVMLRTHDLRGWHRKVYDGIVISNYLYDNVFVRYFSRIGHQNP